MSVTTRAKPHVGAHEVTGDGAGGGCGIHHSAAPARERRGGGFDVGKMRAHAVRILIVLVALAGDQHDVARLRAADSGVDRGGAVEVDGPAAVAGVANAADDRARDCRRVLGARVVAGDDDAVGERRRDTPHLRPLAGVAIAAASEHADELAAFERLRAAAPSAPSPAHRANARSRRRRADRRRRRAAASVRAAAPSPTAQRARRRAARRSRAARRGSRADSTH